MNITKDMIESPCTDATHSICMPKDMIKDISKKTGVQVKGKTKKEVIEKIKKKTNCDTELCVAKKTIAKNNPKILAYYKNIGPRNSTELLSNFDIDDAIKNWTIAIDKKHYNMPFQMIDFYETNTELATVNLNNLIKKGYHSMSVVLNTDVSTGGGIHWFCLFCDFQKKDITLEFFNSSSNPPLPPVKKWLFETKKKLEIDANRNVNIVLVTDKIQHQKSNTECGVYSLYYIYSRIKKIPYKNFYHRIPDSLMFEFRKVLFSTNK